MPGTTSSAVDPAEPGVAWGSKPKGDRAISAEVQAALCINGMQPATHVLDPGAEAGERIRLEIDVTDLDPASPSCPAEPAVLPRDASVTGHVVLYQTVSVEFISDLVVLEPQRFEGFDNHKNWDALTAIYALPESATKRAWPNRTATSQIGPEVDIERPAQSP